MKSLKINDLFVTGTGVGVTDLAPYDITIDETVAGVDIDTVIGTGNLASTLVEASDYKYNMNLRVKPGYFYISDKEFYYYNTKVSQFSRASVSSGESFASIALQSYPDSIYSYYEKTGEKVQGGAAPIIVESFPSGDLSAKGILFDIPIPSTGCAIGYGYRKSTVPNEESIYPFVSGEPGDYPGYVSPLSPYEKCFESWATSGVLSESDYRYDIESNRIIFNGDPSLYVGKEYALHWESANEPFSIRDVNLNPVETLPENSILCLGIDSVFNEPVSSVYMESDKTLLRPGDSTVISAVARGKSDNRVPNATLYFLVDFSDISKDGYLVQHSGENYLDTSSGYSWVLSDFMSNPIDVASIDNTGTILIGKNKRCCIHSGAYMHMPAGKLSLYTGTIGQHISARTDINGNVIFTYTVPEYIYDNYTVRITCFDETGKQLSSIYLETVTDSVLSNSNVVNGTITTNRSHLISEDSSKVVLLMNCSRSSNSTPTTEVLDVELPCSFSPPVFSGCSYDEYYSALYENREPIWLPFDRYYSQDSGAEVNGAYAIESKVYTEKAYFYRRAIRAEIDFPSGTLSDSSVFVVQGYNLYDKLILDRKVTFDEYI